MFKAQILIAALCLISVIKAQELYTKVVNDVDPNAKCLDGSSPFFYFHQGSQPSKFLIFFIGGGLCSGLDTPSAIEDCYKRSKTQLGSSLPWPSTFNASGMGFLSTNPQKNAFAQWTKIAVGYCDGSLHQGYRQNPISYKSTSLYFRGAVNSRALFKWLQQKHNYSKADKVVITGASAGGIATYIWGNYAASKVDNPANVVLVADSGIFLAYKTYKTQLDLLVTLVKNNYKLANLDQSTPLSICNQKYPDQQYKCLFLENSFIEVTPNMLLINSEYDSWVINNTLMARCLTLGSSGQTLKQCDSSQLQYIEEYRTKYMNLIEILQMFSRMNVWTIGCSNHGYTFDDFYYDSKNQTVNGRTVRDVVQSFVLKGERIQVIDKDPWPSNKGCSY